MGDKSSVPGTGPDALVINKQVVLDSFKAACLIASWARSVHARFTGTARGVIDDTELNEDLAQWSVLEALSADDIRTYDQVEDPRRLLAVMSGLSLTMLLSSDKTEAYRIRREWIKIRTLLRERHRLDLSLPGNTFLDLAREGLSMPSEGVYLVLEHMPELKQGWDEGGADGVRDYLTVLSLGMRDRRRLE
jgi:hypothetical protein